MLDFPDALLTELESAGQALASAAVNARADILTEVIGASEAVLTPLVMSLRSAGYTVDLDYVQADPIQAWHWNLARSENNISAFFAEEFNVRWLVRAAEAAAAPSFSGSASSAPSERRSEGVDVDGSPPAPTLGVSGPYWLRWLAVLPAGLLGGALLTFPLHLVLYATLRNFIDPYPELPERILTPFVIAVGFVWLGARVAPARKVETAVVLFGLWMVILGGVVAITILGTEIAGRQVHFHGGALSPAMAFLGGFVGFLVVRQEHRGGVERLS